MEFPPPDRHDRISRTCSLFCPLPVPIAAQACCPPARSRASDSQQKNLPAQKYIPRQSRDHIKKAPSRVPFCLGKMARSDRLECGRKLGIKEKTQLQPSAWWKERSVQIGKAVPLITRKRLAAPRRRCEDACSQAAEANGTFAEKEEGWSGMRKARSRIGLFEWSAVHSDVG